MPPNVESPLLPSFRVQGFRAFRDLHVPRLGRVNLVVGKNNVGKTTFLESLKVYSAGVNAPWELRNLLEIRQEVQRGSPREERTPRIDLARAFFRYPQSGSRTRFSIDIGPTIPEKQLTIRIGWQTRHQDDTGRAYSKFSALDEEPLPGEEAHVETLEVRVGQSARRYRLEELITPRPSRPWATRPSASHDPENSLLCHYIPARGFESSNIGALWDSIVLTDNEQAVLNALQIIAPDIERVSLVEAPGSYSERYALVARKERQAPEPLRSMGDGMNRIFEIALGLVNSKNGLLLIDEVENGVHYAAQESLWRFIFEASSNLGVQVFATTHSWDCIEAFQRAATAHRENGFLISLAQVKEDIKAAVFNENDLEIITRESIEVR